MQICLSHRFEAPVEAVVRALASAQYAAHLGERHSFFADIRVLESRERERVIERSVRYRAQPFITRLGVFSLPPSWFVWVEQSRIDLERGLLEFENVPEVASVRGKLINRGAMQFRAQLDEAGNLFTLREARFEVAFEVAPLLRPLADAALSLVARQLVSSLDEEARLLRAWLDRAASEETAAAA
ncbi:MAG: hypothetical protein JWN48_2860 [Myxococcaceae bacterium]|nr:hypothetical protein [Myxococcaceae bacterium]